MTETSTSSTIPSSRAPHSGGVAPGLFWGVTAVLAVAIAGTFFLVNKDLNETRVNFSDALIAANKSQEAKTEKAVSDAKSVLNAEIAKLQEENKKLAESSKMTSENLAMLAKDYDTFAKKELPTIKKEAQLHASEIATTKSDLSQTNANVNKVETEVKYLKENVDKINGKLLSLDKDIANLTTGSAELKEQFKKEYAAIKTEVDDVNRNGLKSREDMEKLKNRTVEFELKVLSERAKQAADYAKQGDLKNMLRMIDFKGN